MPPDHATDLARAEAAREAADAAIRLARRNRGTAQAEINRIHAAMAADAKAADAERWADPALAARLAEAREIEAAATAQRDAVRSALTAEYTALERKNAATFRANFGRSGEITQRSPLGTTAASRVQEDTRMVAAEQTWGDAHALVRRLARLAHRSAQSRRYLATSAELSTRRRVQSSPVTAALFRLGVRREAPGADRVETYIITNPKGV